MDRSEWVRVPRKMTDAMREAATLGHEDVDDAWDEIIAAAPPPPAEQASGELPSLVLRRDSDGKMQLFHSGFNLRFATFSPGVLESERCAVFAALSQRPVVGEDSTELRKIAKRNLRSLIDRLGDDADKRTMLLCLEELS